MLKRRHFVTLINHIKLACWAYQTAKNFDDQLSRLIVTDTDTDNEFYCTLAAE